MRAALLVGLGLMGCATTNAVGAPRPDVLRDVEGYAIAGCLIRQSDPALKDQGDGWASVIVQRTKGDLEPFKAVTESVRREIAKGDMAVIRDESTPNGDKILPVLYCGEIIDEPDVRVAIEKAVRALEPSYR